MLASPFRNMQNLHSREFTHGHTHSYSYAVSGTDNSRTEGKYSYNIITVINMQPLISHTQTHTHTEILIHY